MNLSKIGRNIARIDNNAKKVYSVATPEDNEEHELKMINQSVIKEGKFVYTPNNEGRDTISVLGMSGSGKSYWIKQYCESYHKKHPKHEIFLFSEATEDPLFDGVSYIKRVDLNENVLSDPIEWTEFRDCLTVWDDIDAIKGSLKKFVFTLRDKLLKNSRKFGVSVVVSQHNYTDGHDSKTLLNESGTIVFFMGNNFNRSIQYLLSNYIGLNKEAIEKLKNTQTRATIYVKSYPQIIITDRMITTVNELSKK